MEVTVVCIATIKRPTDKDKFNEEIRKAAEECGLKLAAVKGCLGYGCYNLGLRLEGDADKAKGFADALTGALMPARWSYASDQFEGFVYEDL